jgi:hypothetical protein
MSKSTITTTAYESIDAQPFFQQGGKEMSDAVLVGLAAIGVAGVAGCAAAVGVGLAVYRGLEWLSEEAQREMERLKRQLEAPPTHATTKEAREAFERQLASLKSQASKNPTLKNHADAVARILAIENSPLGAFLNAEQKKTLSQPGVTNRSLHAMMNQAARGFTQSSASGIAQSIVDVARNGGFIHQTFDRRNNGKHTLVMTDDRGRSVVAEVVESEDGAKINLDLTGFGDRHCHPVMDQLLSGLAEKGIHLRDLRRRSHYCRKGILLSELQHAKPARTPIRTAQSQQHHEAGQQRRYWINRQTVRS